MKRFDIVIFEDSNSFRLADEGVSPYCSFYYHKNLDFDMIFRVAHDLFMKYECECVVVFETDEEITVPLVVYDYYGKPSVQLPVE